MPCRYGIVPQYSKGCCCENCCESIRPTELQKMRMIQLHCLWNLAYVSEWKVSVVVSDFGIFLQVHNKQEQVSNDCI